MKICLVTGTNSRNAGGLFNSVKSLAFGLQNEKGTDVEIVSFNDEYSNVDIKTYGDIRMPIYNILGPKKIGFSNDLLKLLEHSKPEIIHQQGIWMHNSKVANTFQRKYKFSKHVIAPRGMLDQWALKNSGWKKKIAGLLFEYSNLKEADCIHALCESEYLAIRAFGLKNPVAIIPNGIHLEHNYNLGHKSIRNKQILLYIGRLHPKKGLHHLIDAFNIIKSERHGIIDNWELRIAGWSQGGYEKQLKRQIKEYNLESNIKFLGSLYGDSKKKELLNASAFILPSYSEGLPMSVLEAWSFKLPVFMTDECNLPEGFISGGGIRIDRDKKLLAKTMVEYLSKPSTELEFMGQKGYDLVTTHFTWPIISHKTISLYRWLHNPKLPCPDFVKLQ